MSIAWFQHMSGELESFLVRCDPILCFPQGLNHTAPEHAVDCIAQGIWPEYKPRFSGPRLSKDCPAVVFLNCNANGTDPQVAHTGQIDWTKKTGPKFQPVDLSNWNGREDGSDERTAKEEKMDEQTAQREKQYWLSHPVPRQSPPPGKHESWARVLKDQDGQDGEDADAETSEGPTMTTMPMPEDPIQDCSLTPAVALFHDAHLEAPTAISGLYAFAFMKIVLLIPMLVVFALGFWWGKDFWTQTQSGFAPYALQQAHPQVRWQGITAQQQDTELQISQPLISQA